MCAYSLLNRHHSVLSDTVVMVTPDSFNFNNETAKTNFFQKIGNISDSQRKMVINEFYKMVETLKKNGINVILLKSKKNGNNPDSIFPNNWFSVNFNNDNRRILIIYPMLTKNRSKEQQPVNLIKELEKNGIHFNKIINLSRFEWENHTLEGTGSIVLDRKNKILYSSISSRTDKKLVDLFCKNLGYRSVVFHSYDLGNNPIYHTNVMLSIGSNFAIVSLKSIHDIEERKNVIKSIIASNKQIIEISPIQVNEMDGNILELQSQNTRDHKIILSFRAFDALTGFQKDQLSRWGKLIPIDIDIIEKVGGGGVRCMMAEVF
ncbi:Predicted amidinotransferase, FN0238 type family protein (plasmid) [Buchnera aphidicola (Thelaxes suberi)]